MSAFHTCAAAPPTAYLGHDAACLVPWSATSVRISRPLSIMRRRAGGGGGGGCGLEVGNAPLARYLPCSLSTALCTGPRAFSCLLSYIWTEPDVCTQCVVVDKKADVGASCQQTNSHARSFRLTARPDEHAPDAKHVELMAIGTNMLDTAPLRLWKRRQRSRVS